VPTVRKSRSLGDNFRALSSGVEGLWNVAEVFREHAPELDGGDEVGVLLQERLDHGEGALFVAVLGSGNSFMHLAGDGGVGSGLCGYGESGGVPDKPATPSNYPTGEVRTLSGNSNCERLGETAIVCDNVGSTEAWFHCRAERHTRHSR
jgi:hypothetical protein